MNYQDKCTFWHDKPCTNGEPSSNNRLIYTAYSKYLADKPSQEEHIIRKIAFEDSVISYVPLKVNRLPNKPFPPMSKDEIIGAVSQGFITAKELEDSHWNFCNLAHQPERLTFKAVSQAIQILYKIRGEHRNYVWQNNIEEAYPLAFYLAPWDQYYVKKFYHEEASILQTIAFYVNAWNVIKKGDKSSRMMLWLQCKDLNHWLLKYIDEKQWVVDYFGENHPFVKKVLDGK